MKIRDQAFWQGQKAEIAQSDDRENGAAFIAFIESWCDKAEECLLPEETPDAHMRWFRSAFTITEAILGSPPPRWTAHMMLVIMGSWAYWNRGMWECLTPLEKQMIADEAAMVNAELQEAAT